MRTFTGPPFPGETPTPLPCRCVCLHCLKRCAVGGGVDGSHWGSTHAHSDGKLTCKPPYVSRFYPDAFTLGMLLQELREERGR